MPQYGVPPEKNAFTIITSVNIELLLLYALLNNENTNKTLIIKNIELIQCSEVFIHYMQAT